MPDARHAPAAAALSDGRDFVFGGNNGNSCLASIEYCHLQANWSHTIATASTTEFWRPLKSMRKPREYHAAVAFKGKIIVAGGYAPGDANNCIRLSVVEVFSPPDTERPRGEWTRVADLRVPRSNLALLIYIDNLYASGDDKTPMNTIEKFIPGDPPTVTKDLSSWSWAALDSLNDLQYIYGAVVV